MKRKASFVLVFLSGALTLVGLQAVGLFPLPISEAGNINPLWAFPWWAYPVAVSATEALALLLWEKQKKKEAK